MTLNSRLVRASQATKKPIPSFRKQGDGGKIAIRVDAVKINRRGKGDSFGVNVPMEPLVRAGLKVGRKLSVRVLKGRIVLSG